MTTRDDVGAALTCQSLIRRTYKTRKADVAWPESVYGPTGETGEVCGGTVTVKLTLETSGGCSCCGSTQLVAEWDCTRCEYPYVPGRLVFDAQVARAIDGVDVTALLTTRKAGE